MEQALARRHKERRKEARVACNAALSGKKGEERAAAEEANREAQEALEAELAAELERFQLGETPEWLKAELEASVDAPAQTQGSAKAKAPVPLQKNGKPLSKAQMKHIKQRELDKAKVAKDAQAKSAAGPTPREIESSKIDRKLSKEGLRVREMEADGHCLYRAVADQLEQCGKASLTSKTSSEPHMVLRSICANYMQKNRSQFEPFVAAEDSNTSITFDKYVDRVKNSSEWGGQLELQALSGALETPIQVLSADDEPVVMGEHFAGDPLTVTYHRHFLTLGEHYNSVQASES